MPKHPPHDLTPYEEEAVPFDDVMRELLQAKPKPVKKPKPKAKKERKTGKGK